MTLYFGCRLFTISALTALLLTPLVSIRSAEVPHSVTELWSDFDPAKDPLETEILKSWEQDGVVCHRRMDRAEMTSDLLFGRPMRWQADCQPGHAAAVGIYHRKVFGEGQRQQAAAAPARGQRGEAAADLGQGVGER